MSKIIYVLVNVVNVVGEHFLEHVGDMEDLSVIVSHVNASDHETREVLEVFRLLKSNDGAIALQIKKI